MRFYQVRAFIIASWAASAYGLVIPDKTPIEGYGIFVPQWEFDTGFRAEKVVVNGTVEDLLEELRLHGSLYEQALGPDLASSTSSPVLKKRNDFGDGRVICYNFPKGLNAAARDGINLLKQIRHRRPTNQAGPGECGRMSCSESTAIWWCNEDDKPKTPESFRIIADGADKVLKTCGREGWPTAMRSSGQAFHKTKWNVIVRGEKC